MNQPVVVIGGVGAILGVSLCDTLAERGYRVIALSRSPLHLDSAEWVQCDLTDAHAVAATFGSIASNHDGINAYIHNLGQFAHQPFLSSSAEQFAQLWTVNCLSAFHAASAVLPLMLNNSQGSIVFTGATASTKGSAEFSAFASAKFALRGMAQALAREFGPRGIHVAHVIIDGVMWSQRARNWGMDKQQCLQPQAVATTIWHLLEQDRSAWTHELDIRPDVESF